MDIRLRIVVAFILFGCFIVGMFGFEDLVLPLITPEEQSAVPGVILVENFTASDFRYGPQTWRPYYEPLSIDPSQNASTQDMWYMMYIDMNGTAVGGNPDVRRTGALKVDYNFSALAGKAVFHVYGTRRDGTQSRTNRQEGWNRCGYVVYGSGTPGHSMPATTVLPYSVTHDYFVTISNIHGENADDFRAATTSLRFERAGSGLDALHITRDLAEPKGQVTETSERQGSFYVTATGGNPTTELLLLVAVNRMQPEDFSVGIKSEFMGGS